MISRAICIQPARLYLVTIMNEKNRSHKVPSHKSQSILEITWLLLYVLTFEPNFNFMIH